MFISSQRLASQLASKQAWHLEFQPQRYSTNQSNGYAAELKVSNMKRLSVNQSVSQSGLISSSTVQTPNCSLTHTPLLAFVQGKKVLPLTLQLIFTACEEDVMLVASSTRNLCNGKVLVVVLSIQFFLKLHGKPK